MQYYVLYPAKIHIIFENIEFLICFFAILFLHYNTPIHHTGILSCIPIYLPLQEESAGGDEVEGYSDSVDDSNSPKGSDVAEVFRNDASGKDTDTETGIP